MKKNLGLFLILFISGSLFAQSGVDFSDAAWKEALAEAKKQNKLVFLDAYTSWCGPCKMMNKNVFPEADVAKFYNKNFINMKLDMEKGEGLAVAANYDVRMYPTFLFVDGDGEVIHRAVGYHEPAQFVSLGETALDPAKQLNTLAKRFAAGERDPNLLYNYTEACFNAGEGGHGKIAKEYLKTQNDWATEDNMAFLMSYINDAEGKPFTFLVNNRAKFAEQFGGEMVDNRIKNMIYNSYYDKNDPLAIEKMGDHYEKAFGADAPKHLSQFTMTFYQRQGDMENFAKTAVEYYDNYEATSWNELNRVAWTFYENVDDKKQLKKAAKWAEQSVEMDKNYYNTDTAGALWSKLGKKNKAKKYFNMAIEAAKAEGMDYSATQKMLDEL